MEGGELGRQGSGEGHPQGDAREGHQHLGEALDENIGHAAPVAGCDTDGGAEDDADKHTDDRHGERDAGGGEDAREDVATQPAGTEESDHAAFLNAEEAPVARNQAPEFVRLRVDEKVDWVDQFRVFGIGGEKGAGVSFALEAVDEGPGEPAIAEDMHALGRRAQRFVVYVVDAVGRNEVGEERYSDHQHQPDDADDAEAVGHDARPEDATARGHILGGGHI